MAISGTDKIKAIVFLVVSALLLALIIFSLVGTKWMEAKDTYYIEFTEIPGGLSTGSSVRFHGIKVGKVVKMDMDLANQMGCITVEITKNTPVKTDSTATIETESFVTGTRYVQITPGSVEADLLPPNDSESRLVCLKSGFQKFAGNIVNLGAQAPALATNLSHMFSQPNAEAVSAIVQSQVPELLGRVNVFFANQNALMVSSILCRVDGILASNSVVFARALSGFDLTMATMLGILEENRAVTKSLMERLESVSGQADGIMKENRAQISNLFAEASVSMREMREIMQENRQGLKDSIQSLDSTGRLCEEFLRKLNREPSALIFGQKEDKEEWIDEN